MQLALKIDVDTLRGTLVGVPALLRTLKAAGADASFLFSLGPDHTGRALRRVRRTAVRQIRGESSVVGALPVLRGDLLLLLLRRGKRVCAARLRGVAVWAAWLTGNAAYRKAAWRISRCRRLLGRRGVLQGGVACGRSRKRGLLLLFLLGLKLSLQVCDIVIRVVLQHRLRRPVLGRRLGGGFLSGRAEDGGKNHQRAGPKKHKHLHVLLEHALRVGRFRGQFRLWHGTTPSA